MKRITLSSLDELYSRMGSLEAEKADIISVKKEYGRYTIAYRSMAESEQDEILADYERLLRMEKRINTYPDLRRAVRAAMEHEDGLINIFLARHNGSLQGNSRQSHSAQDGHHGQT
jgi:thiamine monophosphate kinase